MGELLIRLGTTFFPLHRQDRILPSRSSTTHIGRSSMLISPPLLRMISQRLLLHLLLIVVLVVLVRLGSLFRGGGLRVEAHAARSRSRG
jgi:hypothetical protein